MRHADLFYRNVLLPPVRCVTRNDAEVAHDWMLSGLKRLQRHPGVMRVVMPHGTFGHDLLRQELMCGLTFDNPFGNAAGFDKTGEVYPALQRLTGVGYLELGGVTLVAQPGNPRPRMVRVGKDNLINAMGFPGDGVDALVDRLRNNAKPDVPLGVQIVKNKDTSVTDTPGEYSQLVRKFAGLELPDFFVINVSSPNTPGLRAFQDRGPLSEILRETTAALDETGRQRRRLLIKVSPDLATDDVATIIELIETFAIGGIILTNTTTTRPVSSRHDSRPGGFSGSALYGRSSRLVKFAARLLPKDKVLVATGGIDTIDRAYEMLQYADLVAGYTGLVLKGPNLFRRLAEGIVVQMETDGVKSLAELRSANRN